MLQTDAIDALLRARRQIGRLIANASSAEPTQRAALRATLLAQRDRLAGAINQLISVEVLEATRELQDKVDELRAACERLRRLGDKLEDVHAATDVIEKVIDTALAVVTLGGFKPSAHT
jgi:hypothetical protein